MAEGPTVLTNFKDIHVDEELRTSIGERCGRIAEEFREIGKFEITLSSDGNGFTAHGHATGKNSDVSGQAGANELAPAVERLLDKLERQLRKVHDKRIFTHRREAQRDPLKKRNSS